ERLEFEEHAAVRAAAALAYFPDDAPGDVVAGEQLRRPAGLLVAEDVAEPLLLVGGGLRLVVVRDVPEHEPLPLLVPQHPALAADALGDEDAADRRRPDHPGRVELDEL